MLNSLFIYYVLTFTILIIYAGKKHEESVDGAYLTTIVNGEILPQEYQRRSGVCGRKRVIVFISGYGIIV